MIREANAAFMAFMAFMVLRRPTAPVVDENAGSSHGFNRLRKEEKMNAKMNTVAELEADDATRVCFILYVPFF